MNDVSTRVAATRWCDGHAPPLEWRRYYRVLEERDGRARVLRVDRPDDADTSGEPLGWIEAALTGCLRPVVRPPLSTPGAQMSALLIAARAEAASRATSGAQRGRCLDALRSSILAAGGYGDLLDLAQDERLRDAPGQASWRYTAAALGLARAIDDAGGPAAFGLEALDVLPPDALPGSILLTRGNGHPGCPIDPLVGDVCVIDGIQGGTLERPIRRMHDGSYAFVLETRALPGRPIECLVAPAQGPVDEGSAASPAGWVERDATLEVPRGLAVHGDRSTSLPATRIAWRTPSLAGCVVALWSPRIAS